ncbi:MAG: hypothetical protein IPP98_08865 [Gemmatimonadetes bacterium]|nr:hypothetical protein [Gemmatimonadota bacterium]
MRRAYVRAAATCLLLGAVAPLSAQLSTPLDSATLNAFRWREIGPANMQGRVTDVEGIPSPSRTFFVAAAAGGIWKTTNGGVTFRPLFTNERVVSMGDLAIAPSDTMQIWAGTGEDDSRNSVSPGQGIYKSMDGGLTWKLMGLEKTQTIARIIVHPTNPQIVYVAALGAIWNSNPERGLYKTTDGGATWRLVKFISDKAGFIDVAMDPTNPNVLFASSYERVRGPYFLKSGGPGSALWKSTDAGETWTEVKGGGFPETMKGRIGLAIAPSNARIMYALVEADTVANPKGKTGVGTPAVSPSGLYRSADGGATWTKMANNNTRPFYYSQVRVDVKNPDRVYWSSTPVNFSTDGGKTVRQTTVGLHVDHHAMWLDPNDENRMVVGNDGGIGISFDKGGNWWFPNSFAIGQFYAVSFDFATPYNVCGGLQDNGAWCGPSRRQQGPITNSMWFTFNGGDGFVTAQDPTDPNVIYGESQGGAMSRTNLLTGESSNLPKPTWRARANAWRDTIAVLEESPTAATPATKKRIAEITAMIAADSAALTLRWNWNTPFFISPHNSKTFYAGSNRVMKSVERGDDMYPISPDLSYADTMKIRVSTRTTGGITTDATGAETFGTIVSLAESYVRPGLLYAGTDDGRVWLTRNDGASWEELTGRFPGVPAGTYVSRIEPSYADTNTVYITFDGHRTGDFTPYVYMTRDYGKTFKSIVANLPTGGVDFAHVVREDPANPNVLYVGTDVGAYLSLNKGGSWQKFMNGLPTVPVHDLKIHPRDRELIAGTHGRSIWIVDVTPLPQMSDSVMALAVAQFKPKTAVQYTQAPMNGESTGQALFRANSPAYGAEISYRVSAAGAASSASILIVNAAGDTVSRLTGPGAVGLHRVTWGFQITPPPAAPRAQTPSQRRDSLLTIKRRNTVFDSLKKAGADTAALARVRKLIENPAGAFPGAGGRGQGGGGGRGAAGGGQAPAWVERPGEGGGGGGGGGGGRGAGGAAGLLAQAAGADSALARTVAGLVTLPGAAQGFGGGGGGGFGGRGGAAQPGDYLVIVRVGGTISKQVLRVERTASMFSGNPFQLQGQDDDDHEEGGGGRRK